MARQGSNGQGLRPYRSMSTGAAVLDREEADVHETQTENLLQEEILRVSSALKQGRLAERAQSGHFEGGDRTILESLNEMLDAVIKPLNVSAEYVDRISKGDIPPKITDTYNGDFNEIKNNLNNCIDNIKALVTETEVLIKASADGQLSRRADVAKHQGDYRRILEGVNEMLDAILLPIGEGNRILAQISDGKIDELIAQTYKGDHEKMKQAVNNVATVLQGLQKELGRLTVASHEGQLSERGKPDQFQGAYAGIVKGVNDMLDAILLPIGEGNRILAQISDGKIDELIAQTYKGDHEKMKQAVNRVATALQSMVADTGLLVKAAVEGKLATRADASKHQGDYRKVVEGVNATLDAVIGPLNVFAEYVDRISKGDIPPKITDTYHGDFNEIKNNLNTCIDVVNALVADTALLTKAAVEGKLATRADASKHQGDYRKVVEGVNATLDAVIGPLNVSAEYVDRISKGDIPPKITDTYHGDFNEIKNNLNTCIDVVNALVADTGVLTKAAVEGKLATRADASKHQGDYRKVVEGVNATLDAVIGPLNVSAEYVDRISKGDIPPKITDIYYGDFNAIKVNLNACIEGLGGLTEVDAVLQRMAINDYSRQVEGKYEGVFASVGQAVNTVRTRIMHVIRTVRNVSQGELGELAEYKKIGRRSEADESVPSLIELMENLKALTDDFETLANEAVEGRLATRADAGKLQGEYRRIVEGVNEMLDAILLPIGEGNRVLTLIRGGNLREKMDIACKGDHAKMKFISRFPTRGYASIARFRPGASAISALANENILHGEVATFDITLFDEQGQVIIDIEGSTMRRMEDADKAADTKSRTTNAAHSQADEPIEVAEPVEIQPLEGAQALTRLLMSKTPSAIVVLAQPPEELAVRSPAPAPLPVTTVPSSGGVEGTLSAWWQEMLGVEHVG